MSTSSYHDSGPAGVAAPRYTTRAGALVYSPASSSDTPYRQKKVYLGSTARSTYTSDRQPLLSQSQREYSRSNDGCCSIWFILILILILILFILFPLVYSVYPLLRPDPPAVDYKSLYQGAQVEIQRLSADNVALGNQVTLYKNMYADVLVRAQHLEQANAALEGELQGAKVEIQRLSADNVALGNEVTLYKNMYADVLVRAQHLEQANAALEGEVHLLQTQLHDIREQLMKIKVLAFWEVVRTMNTNMDVWVGADDPGVGPKFWSYGITTGRYNDNNPPVIPTRFHFTVDQAATIQSKEKHRIVGYKVESNRHNNGWWIATGLDEFGQGGSAEVKFSAKAAGGGAEYEVFVFYADWNP